MFGRRFVRSVILGSVIILGGCQAPPQSGRGGAPQNQAGPVAYMGIGLKAVDLDPGATPAAQPTGIRIEYVLPDSPASAAGLKEDDIIITFAGQPAESTDQVIKVIAAGGVNAIVAMTLLRNGQVIDASVTTQARPADYAQRVNSDRIAMAKAQADQASQAEGKGDTQTAFDHDVRALRYLWEMTDQAASQLDDAVFVQMATMLTLLPHPPGIPAEADRHNRRGLAILQGAKTGDDFDQAAAEFASAIEEAPWLPDLYINAALAFEKAGSAQAALTNYRRYLQVNPRTRDADAVKQKIAGLEPLAEEQAPWLPFVGRKSSSDGWVFDNRLRNHTFSSTVVAAPGSDYLVGEVIVSGTIRGSSFQGKETIRSPDEANVKCFGTEHQIDASGAIDSSGRKVVINAPVIHFNTDTCQQTRVEPEPSQLIFVP